MSNMDSRPIWFRCVSDTPHGVSDYFIQVDRPIHTDMAIFCFRYVLDTFRKPHAWPQGLATTYLDFSLSKIARNSCWRGVRSWEARLSTKDKTIGPTLPLWLMYSFIIYIPSITAPVSVVLKISISPHPHRISYDTRTCIHAL